jgi:hypothetical protein
MPMKKLLWALLALGMTLGCNSGPSKPAETAAPAPKTTDQRTGRSAFQKLYVAAHGWGRDAQPYRLESQVTSDANGRDGKSAVWRGGFASAAQRGTKPYTWSGSIDPNGPERDVTPGTEDTYNPANTSTKVFDIAFLKVDSDKAFEVAQQHGGSKLPADTPVWYALDWSTPTSQLVWHVIYGANRDESKLRVSVDASKGDFIRVEK